MVSERCINQNHSKMNVSVRYCAACGDIVNRKIPNRPCSGEAHAKRRKERNLFCVDCGQALR